MKPIIALVGRPNVGKSTLFNRLTKSRDAIVANYPGLTRDRQYGEGAHGSKHFVVVDTGGISSADTVLGKDCKASPEDIGTVMTEQSLLAIQEADIALFLMDSREGLNAEDQQIATYLRHNIKLVWLVANKIDGLDESLALLPFYELGMGEVLPIAASHGRGVSALMSQVLKHVPEPQEPESEESAKGIKMAIVGRPNVGKSTLVNRLLGEDRVLVFDLPGTTRDSVYIDYERHGKPYTLIDTAGIRRRKNVRQTVEKFSIVKTLQAIDDANVVVLLIDAQEGLVDQDLHLMGHCIESGRALVIALNKWDNLENEHKQYIKMELERRLRFVDFADIHFISALHGTGVGKLYGSIEKAYQSATDKLSTNFLTTTLQDAVSAHPLPMVNGRRIKLRYAHAGGKNPPIIVIHGNQTDAVPAHYSRYLEKTFRQALDLHGTPVKIVYRSSDNPYAGRKNKLTQRQVAKKRRLMKHVKKK